MGKRMVWIKSIGVAFALVVLVIAGLSAYGMERWERTTRELTARLDAARAPLAAKRFDANELDGLPAPVQRYFRAALKSGQPLVGAASFSHTGTFNSSATAESWSPFRSTQRVVVNRPGFVWDARIAILPGIAVHVHDAYVTGDGLLHAAVLGVFTVADQRGSAELARGELLRFLAETAWYPTALLPSQGVRWSPIDERSARAAFDDGALHLALTFTFSADGFIDTVRADARARTVGDHNEMLPWEGRFWNYVERDGMKIPLDGEVAWLTPAGRKPYWRGTIETIVYEFER